MARRADLLFGLTVLASVGLEIYALAVIVASSFGPTRALVHGSPIAVAVVRGLNLTALNAIGVTLIILLLHVATAARRERERSEADLWLERFADEILTGAPHVPQRTTHAGTEALLRLHDALAGAPAAAAGDMLRAAEVVHGTGLARRVRSRFGLLEAFETLARARLPETLPLLRQYLTHQVPTVRFAAARAAARIVDYETARDVADWLADLSFGPRAWLEIALLFRSPDPLIRNLLAAPDPSARWAAVETIGRRHLLAFAGEVVALLAVDDSEVELLAAALRALAKLRYPPIGQEARVLAAAAHDADFVRLQAVRVLALVEGEGVGPALWQRLGDTSFYVRQAAAHALEAVDTALLQDASERHPDPYGRAMARQELPLRHAA